MSQILLQFTRWTEDVRPLWRDSSLPTQPLGTLAATILVNVSLSRQHHRTLPHRLARLMQGSTPRSKWKPSPQTLTGIEAVRWQLRSWEQSRGGTWTRDYSGLDGAPTDELDSSIGIGMLKDIEWKGPAEAGAETLCANSPESAVLLSATYGFLRGVLTPCSMCGHLVIVGRQQGRRQKCPACGALRGSALSPRVRRAYRLVWDRARKRGQLPGLEGLAAPILKASKAGIISEAEALRRLSTLVTRENRGRPTPTL